MAISYVANPLSSWKTSQEKESIALSSYCFEVIEIQQNL